jgi:tetratricopeptide (TPR) repeat protein
MSVFSFSIMKKNQLFLVLGGLVLVLFLYFGVSNIPPKLDEKAPVAARDGGDEHNHESEAPPMITFAELLEKGKKTLSEAQQKQLDDIFIIKDEKKLKEELVHFWGDAKQPHLAAKYNADRAELENSEKSRTFASQFYIDLFNAEPDPAKKQWEAQQAAIILQKVIDKNPSNEQAKVALATCFTDGTGETMKGVLLLREVAEKNPANENAGMQLGKLAIQSGQFDKAIARLEKLILLYPKNAEAHYYLGIAYKGLGQMDKAKQILQHSKTLIKDPKFGKDVDDFIKTF